ncbi:bifunctional riboflavin kinase/FAD synthetase [Halocola ammonii]
MKIYRDISSFKNVEKPIFTTGTFDGVHIGHQKIISRLKDIARQKRGETVMLTFHPHPRMVLFPDDHGLELLSTPDEKAELLEKAGIDHLIVYPFTEEFSRMTAVEYVRDLLVNQIGVDTVVVGYDHHFGRNREGDFEQLKEFAQVYNFDVEEIPALDIENVNVSSTKIRKALAAGDVKRAHQFLNHPYTISGTVVRGEGLGKKIGFPTANISVEESYKLIPAKGVYAVKAEIGEQTFDGMLNIGTRPTVTNEDRQTIEVHLFGLESEIYGSRVTLSLMDRIRDEVQFNSIEELKEQLKKDKKNSKSILE